MKKSKEDLLKAKLALLIRKGKKIKRYNLSGSGWKEYYTEIERDRLYKKAEKTDRKYEENESKIIETIRQLLDCSYSGEDIAREFPDVKYLLSEYFLLDIDDEKSKKK